MTRLAVTYSIKMTERTPIWLTRRTFLAGLASGTALPAAAEAPERSRRPLARGGKVEAAVLRAEDLVARARIDGKVSFVVADAVTGEVLESHEPMLPQPPASTAKALTSLYALDRLGAGHRFTTRLVATGPVENGRVMGDLILAGGGDPTLDTPALARMVSDLKDLGVREIGGRLRVWTEALPNFRQIDGEQPPHVGYNPAGGGLNLNYNRVYFGWERTGSAYQISMDARGGSLVPDVTVAQMEVVDRSTPIYTYEDRGGRDDWTVARHALGASGARWLPVRYPGLYAGEVLQVILRSYGIMSGGAIGRAEDVAGQTLVSHRSAPLADILREMLKYSTNVTAEMVGMSASKANGEVRDLVGSAQEMNDWLSRNFGTETAAFVDHSGLGGDSRISARDMVRVMVASNKTGELQSLMKPFPVYDSPSLQVDAKTGTLNFVSALTGFTGGPSRTSLAFAIFCANTERRDALPIEAREKPPGGRHWLNRARTLQRDLLKRWATVYTA